MRVRPPCAAIVAALALSACGGGNRPAAPPAATVTSTATVALTPTPSGTHTPTPSATPTASASVTATPTVAPSDTPTVSPTPTSPLVVMTDKGPVRGSATSSVRKFLGIPYAAPPVGDLRWRAPMPHAPWTQIRSATAAGSICPQIIPILNARAGREDCLFLNVFTPYPTPTTPAPVMVWIHGGGFTSGDGLEFGATDGSVLAQRDGVVVVTLNYRLGQFGFLAHPTLTAEEAAHPSSGNYGIEDQVAALHWVHDNIAAFGGDAGNVTIFGESAGGWSVCAHLASPLSAGLFHRAIVESGLCSSPLSTLAAAEKQGERFAAQLGCDGAADVPACLRAVSASDVMDTLPPDPNFAFTPGTFGSWQPNVDHEVLTQQIAASLAGGTFNHTPLLIGSNRDEGTLFVALAQDFVGMPLTAAEYPQRLKSLLGDDALVAQVMAQYPLGSYATPGAALAAAFGDGYLACPTIDAATLAAPVVPTYLYQFEYPDGQFALASPVALGAFHSAEIQFVFDQPPAPTLAFTSDDAQLADAISGYWTRFAATGDPNGPAAITWPRDDAAAYLGLDRTITAAQGPKAAACAFWHGLDYQRPPLSE